MLQFCCWCVARAMLRIFSGVVYIVHTYHHHPSTSSSHGAYPTNPDPQENTIQTHPTLAPPPHTHTTLAPHTHTPHAGEDTTAMVLPKLAPEHRTHLLQDVYFYEKSRDARGVVGYRINPTTLRAQEVWRVQLATAPGTRILTLVGPDTADPIHSSSKVGVGGLRVCVCVCVCVNVYKTTTTTTHTHTTT